MPGFVYFLAYDICEDEPTLDYIESEMAREGVTQEVKCISFYMVLKFDMWLHFYFDCYTQLIDEIRASTEKRMLTDLKVTFKHAPIWAKANPLNAVHVL